jgi:hypothetical protein
MADFFVFKLTEIWNPKPFRPAAAGEFSRFEGKHRNVRKKMQNRSKKNAGILDNRLCKVVYLQCWEWLFSPQSFDFSTTEDTESHRVFIIRCCHPEERKRRRISGSIFTTEDTESHRVLFILVGVIQSEAKDLGKRLWMLSGVCN